ncbi:MAG: hypothetical protein MN733_40045, partial [Nitrososphaera sp.]|nr:hypothetical protein [Nitrososphaera sp.]
SSKANSRIDDGVELLYFRKIQTLKYDLAKTFLEGWENSLFLAVIETGGLGTLLYGIDPFIEEQAYLAKAERSLILRNLDFDLVCQIRRAGEFSHSPEERGKRFHGYEILKHTLDCTITDPFKFLSDYFNFNVAATMTIRAVDQPSRGAMFYLYQNLKVDSVRCDTGPIKFFQGDESNQVWVEFDQPLSTEQPTTVTIYYHGDVLKRLDARLVLYNYYWYPRQNSWGKQSFDVTFRCPSDFTVAAVGNLIERSTEGDMTITRWKTEMPARAFSFNIGRFKVKTIREDGVPSIDVLFTGAADEWIAEELTDDMLNALRLFQLLYGPPPANTLYATEIPGFHGEAHPGLIHFTSLTMLKDVVAWNSSSMLAFRAHEVAHQWWGIGVDYRSYHDRWLSEGFAEYSGLLYMQTALKDNEEFYKSLSNYKKRILQISPDERMPISLGHRNNNYSVQIYEKGAWVLHMLKMMTIDLRTLNEDTFNSIMSTYYKRYRNRAASTDDFRRIVEEKTGKDMSWFFRQWIDGTDIPEYSFSYTPEKLPDGKFKVRCKVTQSNVPDDFQAYVVLRLNFSGDRFARTRVLVKGKISEFDLPVLPAQPLEIIFNDMESVLCEVD